MLHFSFKSWEHYKSKMERYGSLKALEMYNKGKKASIFHFAFRPLYKFLANYIIRLGFLDGKIGWQICTKSSYATYLKYKTLRDLWKSKTT